jgi:tetratricopeptide (TPR) repeat protein
MTLRRGYIVVVLLALACECHVVAQGTDAPAEVIAALRRGEPAEAERLLAPYLNRAPQDATLLTLKGMALAKLDRTIEALQAYEAALRSRPDSLAALQGAAEIEYRLKQPGVRARLIRLLEVDPGNAVAHAMAGALDYERQDCRSALGHFERAGPVVHENDVALWQLGHCLYVAERPTDAAVAFQELLTRVGRDASKADVVRYNLGLALFTSGDHAKAIEILEPLGERTTPDADVLGLLSDVYQQANRVEDAVTLLRRATVVFPAQDLFYVRLGALCLEHESFALAREIADIGLRHVPRSAKLHALRGIVLSQLGDYELALDDFKRAAELDPEQPAAIAGVSVTLQQGGQTEASIDLLRRQAHKRPDDALANLLLGQALLQGGTAAHLEEAATVLERAVAADPRLEPARAELGKLYLKTNRLDSAVEQLSAALSLDPSDKQATYQLLIALRRAGREERARELAMRVRTLLEDEKAAEVARNRLRLMKAEPDR